MDTTTEDKKARMREYQKNYCKNNPEKVAESKRKWREKNKDKIAAEGKEKRKLQREKLKAQAKKWAEENPDAIALQRTRRRIANLNRTTGNSLKFHYGVTLDAYKNISVLQNGVCLICGEFAITNKVKRLVVDHDHEHGQLRGLLCHRCNCGLGYFKDNIDRLKKAVDYLSEFNEVKHEQEWENRVRIVLEELSKKDSKGPRKNNVG